MNFHRPALLCLLTALACTPALAQSAATATATPTSTPAPSKGEAQALRIFNMLDANGDGRISLKEAEAGFRLRPSLRDDFKAADINRDGYLTQAEIRAVADRRRAERQARRQREAEASSQPVAARPAANPAPPTTGTSSKAKPTAPVSPRQSL